MIFLPDLAQVQKHIQGAKGANLSLVQDRKDAIRIIAYDSDSKEDRHYHVYQDANGKVERIELCEPTGKLPDGRIDYRPNLPCEHPDLGYEVSSMLHVAREVLEETGFSEIEFTVYCNATRHSQEFASNFHPRIFRKGKTFDSIQRVEKYHTPKALLLMEIGSHIAKQFELAITYDGDCDYGGELCAKLSKDALTVQYVSNDDEAPAGFVIKSIFTNGQWEHSTELWFDEPGDPVDRMDAIANPIPAFERHIEEHLNLSSIVPSNCLPLKKPECKNGEIVFELKPGALFGHDEAASAR